MSGRLVYVVGPSGAGKDSVLARLRSALRPEDRVVIAHRYITRLPRDNSENHIALSEAEFLLRAQAGCFALHWQGHGLHYGVGVEIELWLAQGLTVLVNGSRAYLPEARRRFPQLRAVCITAAPETIAARLAGRGRETHDEIVERLRRNAGLADAPVDKLIANDGALGDAVSELSDWLSRSSAHC
ncbi:phosphonate metabolism protein/1,5-bisphosphokinase (PRPP-forming) PhnN [Uliginosibacterium sp. H1]|uniref:phosphonate metabolism protein/1,5-bisphosphokinase (PRPP-forming) PhnN n=1 Tax=Uliginosibacterium sp. H1 TaxID=3114757 RepID=UPI002E184E75|nr:phosphonate metabolism protein/1,5-bisphosphokinase (PRPP-forming) PhnN [Uliginosibacterium sp. H1]